MTMSLFTVAVPDPADTDADFGLARFAEVLGRARGESGRIDPALTTPELLDELLGATRAGALTALTDLTLCEAEYPRVEPEGAPAGWVRSWGYLTALLTTRLAQTVTDLEAMAALHRAGHNRAGWAVLSQAMMSSWRGWAISVEPVDEPRDEARRSSRAWLKLAAAADQLIDPVTVHPHDFEIGHDEDPVVDTMAFLAPTEDTPAGGTELLAAIQAGWTLAHTYVPGAVQAGRDGLLLSADRPTDMDSAAMATLQRHLAVELLSIAVPYAAECGAEFEAMRSLHGPDPAVIDPAVVAELFARYGRPAE